MTSKKSSTITIPDIPLSISHRLFQIGYKLPDIDKNIELTVKGNRAYIMYNRPQRMNSFSLDMYGTFIEYMNWANENSDIKFIIITGAGGNFSSGNDLANFYLEEMSVIDTRLKAVGMAECLQRVGLAILNSKKPILAVVQGKCIGFAFTQLALYDKVFAVHDTHFMAPLVKIAQGPEMCSSCMFPKIFGQSMAQQLIIKGKRISASELQKYNFLKCCKHKEEALSLLQEHIREIEELDWNSYIQARRLMLKQNIDQLKKVNREECQNLIERWSNPDLPEYLMNYMKKRKEAKPKL